MAVSDLQQALDYLYGLNPGAMKLGLENTQRLLRHFDNPHLKVPTVHIAGTNGKGSTAALTESILRASGLRTGLYTSPHLLHFSERIQVNRSPIKDDDLADLIFRVKQAVEDLNLPITFFEFGTVMAFLYFLEKETEWNIIEVGLGGRLDATNLCQPEISMITSIGRDHTQYLGTDLKQIAYEKACIIKDFGTVFAHLENEGALSVIKKVASERSAALHLLGKDFQAQFKSLDPNLQTFDFSYGEFHFQDLQIPLMGKHQVANAGLALAACLQLKRKGLFLNEKIIRQGLKNTHWEGRLEVISTRPFVILDCAHNPDGVRSLTHALQENFSFRHCILVLGIMKDKPAEEMLNIFSEFADRLILVKPNQDRAMPPSQLKSHLESCQKPIEIVEQIPYALQTAKKTANPDDLICVTGSIFTVAEAKQFLADDPSV